MLPLPLENKNGITVRELLEFLYEYPLTDPITGEESEVWLTTGRGVSSPATRLSTLNRSDILLTPSNWDENGH